MLGAVTPTQVSSNIWGLKWGKHVYSALLVATALVDAHVYEVVERSPEIQRMLVALVAEGMSVAEAEGIHLEAFDEFDPAWYRAGRAGDAAAVARAMAAISRFYRSHTKTKTGIWRDLVVRKRKTEVEAHLGGDARAGGTPRSPDPADPPAPRADRGDRDRPPPHGVGEPRRSRRGQTLTAEQFHGEGRINVQ